ncbi:uncharacterized protein LOC143888492 [Tasmannia lanceolata]|uniref:uncharacterized protein LOC143888492 n=1 Tax=Tasmannia lanceolata TaxID=3420 RepID=UPI00406434CB
MLIANFETPRILVDNGSSADILYYHAFKQLGIKDDLLKPSTTKLYGFAREVVRVVGSIELHVLMGNAPPQATAMVDFLVVNTPSVYNAILGRPGQNLLKAIPSAYHQKMKFITPRGLGKVKGDQIRSRECYVTALKGKRLPEAMPIEMLDLRDEAQAVVSKPVEELVHISLYEDQAEKTVQIGSSLDEEVKNQLIQFLRSQKSVDPIS